MPQNTEKAERNSGLELLRFIAIILIVMHHACISGGIEIFKTAFSPNHFVVAAFGIWGMFGVDVFFLLAFWFMLEIKYTFRIERWIKLVVQTVLLSMIALAIGAIVFHESLLAKTVVKTILSPALNTYWYITAYLLAFIFLPFFERYIESFQTKHWLRCSQRRW